MHLCPIDQIRIRERRNRRIFPEESLRQLAESLAGAGGLIHLPVCRLSEENGRELLAGERRMRAMQLLWAAGRTFCYMNEAIPLGQFPHALISEVDTLTARTIELEENIQRMDLSWQERAVAVAELHELRCLQNPKQTLADTAEEGGLGHGGGTVRQSILLARNLNDPEISKAANAKDAMKKLSRKAEIEFRTGAALALGSAPRKSPHTLVLGDALALLPTLPAAHFDVILTDPPYGVNAETFRANMTVMHKYDDDWNTVEHLLEVLAVEGLRVTKKQAHTYVFCDVLMFLAIRDIFDEAGWSVWPRPLIWVKDVGHIPNANLGPQRRYECILYANKGNRPVTALYPDVISCPAVNNKFHAAEKPVGLYLDLLHRSVIPGDRVLDPFCGSGSVFEATHKLQCIATGFDNDPASFQYAQERIAAL